MALVKHIKYNLLRKKITANPELQNNLIWSLSPTPKKVTSKD